MTAIKPNKRAKGTGTVFRVPSDPALPVQYWKASLELPERDGKRRRKQIRRKTKGLVEAELNKQRRLLVDQGDISTSGETFGKWAEYWFREFVVKNNRPKTAANYRSSLNNHIIPALGKKRLDQITPAHIRQMHTAIVGKGLASTTALFAHNVLTASLTDAMREGRIQKNPATLTRAPRKSPAKLAILTGDHGVQVLRTVLTAPDDATPADRLGSRWAAALLTGARQGELIGLELDRVTDVLDLSWQLQRLTWLHGCDDPCGRKRGTDCPARKLDSPADWEHRHVEGGLWLSRPKSDAGWRIIPLVEPLRSIILERVRVAATEPNTHGFVWTADPKRDKHGRVQPLDGSPIDPSRDNAEWHRVLERAGVPSVRLHDARHTTATLLQKARVPMSVRMRILGHGSAAMVEHYTDVDDGQIESGMTALSALLPFTDPQL
ncbi:MAG: tyrosine-type recombinase/integrase [Kineosporiaceae bacterium]|nr:tyrosine-type recombinase/integrase [Aeromicrobium sp.]